MNKIEAQGKTVEDAIREGLKMMNATLDEVDVKIINEGGFFRKAQVVLTRSTPEPEVKVMVSEEPRSHKLSEKPAKASQLEIVSVIEPEADLVKATKPEQATEVVSIKSKPRLNNDAKPNNRSFSEEQIKQIKAFIEQFLKELKLDDVTIVEQNTPNALMFTIEGDKASSIIGHRGECLQAIQTIVNTFTRTKDMRGGKVTLNTGNYRERREETLRSMANRLATKAVSSGRSVRMDPMNAYERRIVHDELTKNTEITTESFGNEPRRYITISPKK